MVTLMKLRLGHLLVRARASKEQSNIEEQKFLILTHEDKEMKSKVI
jgi:hypothetical protein